MESPPISPISCHSPPLFPQSYPRAPQIGVPGHSHSSTMESMPWRQSTYSRTSSDDSLYLPMENLRSNRRRPISGRNSSEDSLHVPVNNRQTIKRWNGITREAINWNSLPRDPELFFPTGNCLVYLYPAGHSQRGPSFRIPYHVLLYSGCQPLVQQCLVSTLNLSMSGRQISKPLSHGTVDYAISEDTRTYLYLYPPAGLSRDESHSYHITTRNFFAWLLGVPLVGPDPVSALLDLKARMDIWRDPNANNFEAIFEYAKQQAYGDFEEIQIEMDKRTESERKPAKRAMNPSNSVHAQDRPHRQNTTMIRRNDSLQQRLRSTVAKTPRSHIALQDKRVEHPSAPVGKRQALPRLATFSTLPAATFTADVDGALRRMSGPARVQSSDAVSPIQAREMAKLHRRTSSSTSISPVSSLTPVDSNGIDAALQRLTGPPSTESVVTTSSTQATKANKKKHRVSWADNNPTAAEARSSQTDLTYPNMRGLGLQSAQASSSAINVAQPNAFARRSLTSLPLSSNPAAGPSKRASMPVSSPALSWGEQIRGARPMSTASLISIPTMRETSTPINLEPCSCCGKLRKPDAGLSQQHHAITSINPEPCSYCGKTRRLNTDSLQQQQQQHHHRQSRPESVAEPCPCSGNMHRPETSSHEHQQPRPASARSMKSFRSTKSWRSLRSIRSSLSLRSIQSYTSLSSIRSYLSRRSVGKKSFADLQASMKNRRTAFKARLNSKVNKTPNLKVDTENSAGPENAFQSCNPNDYATLRPRSRYHRVGVTPLNPTPVELEAEPVFMKTVPELTSSDTNPWSPDSYSDSAATPPEEQLTAPTTIRPKEFYTSREYRHQPKPHRAANFSHLLDLDLDSTVLDIGTPGGFEDDFVDTLLAQLEAAGIAERDPSRSNGKSKPSVDDIEEDGGVWMGMRSGVGVPRLEVRAMG